MSSRCISLVNSLLLSKALLRHKQFIFNLFAFTKCSVSFQKWKQLVTYICYGFGSGTGVLIHVVLFILIFPVFSLLFVCFVVVLFPWREISNNADLTGLELIVSTKLALTHRNLPGFVSGVLEVHDVSLCLTCSLFPNQLFWKQRFNEVPTHADSLIYLKGLFLNNKNFNGNYKSNTHSFLMILHNDVRCMFHNTSK